MRALSTLACRGFLLGSLAFVTGCTSVSMEYTQKDGSSARVDATRFASNLLIERTPEGGLTYSSEPDRAGIQAQQDRLLGLLSQALALRGVPLAAPAPAPARPVPPPVVVQPAPIRPAPQPELVPPGGLQDDPFRALPQAYEQEAAEPLPMFQADEPVLVPIAVRASASPLLIRPLAKTPLRRRLEEIARQLDERAGPIPGDT